MPFFLGFLAASRGFSHKGRGNGFFVGLCLLHLLSFPFTLRKSSNRSFSTGCTGVGTGYSRPSIAKELYPHKANGARWVKWVEFLCSKQLGTSHSPGLFVRNVRITPIGLL